MNNRFPTPLWILFHPSPHNSINLLPLGARKDLPTIIAPTTKPPRFPSFSHLPLELRDQIWNEALPHTVNPLLYFWKRESLKVWPIHCLPGVGQRYGDEDDDHPTSRIELSYDLDAQIELPLFYVNREARCVTLAWLRKQGIRIRYLRDVQRFIFVRPFDPMCDALYIPLAKWVDSRMEASFGFFRMQSSLKGQRYVNFQTEVTRIAMTEDFFQSAIAILHHHFRWLSVEKFHWQVVFLVIEAPPDMRSVDNDMNMQQKWELESICGGSFVWNKKNGHFYFHGERFIGGKELYNRIQKINKEIRKWLRWGGADRCEVRPVLAVRK